MSWTRCAAKAISWLNSELSCLQAVMKLSAITRADMASLVLLQVASLTVNKRKLDEFTMVLYNNVLSLPMLLLAAGINGEFATILAEPALRNTRFQAAACLSAICGFLISFCSLWFLSTTTATTYSLVGSLNKMPIAVLGLLFFDSSWDAKNLASIAVGLAAGVVFVRAKQSSS